MQRTYRLPSIAARAALLVVAAAAAVSDGKEPFVNTPPPPGAVCPKIEESYALCSDDPWSGNCADFVSAAAALSQLYLFNVEREPDRADHFKTSIWWGCGSKNFSELKALLARIDSPKARAVLRSQPYQSLASPHPAERAAPTPRSGTSASIDCTSLESWSEQSACASQELAAARAAHQRAFEACKETLAEPLRSQLVSQERAWKANLGVGCEPSDASCLVEANRERDAGIKTDYPQCGRAPAAPPSLASNVTGTATNGMLPARWTPAHGQTQTVPFSFEAKSMSTGTMSTTLGKGGEHLHGSYVRVEASTKGDLVTAIYNGWSGAEWELWKHDPDGQWTATGVSLGDFAQFYTGKVVAVLNGNDGSSMRCQLTLTQPERGLLGGGTGACQISDGGRLALKF